MKLFRAFLIASLSLVLLSACNGSGTGGYYQQAPVVQPQTFDGREVVYDNNGNPYVNIAGDLVALAVYKSLFNTYGHGGILGHYHSVNYVRYNPSNYTRTYQRVKSPSNYSTTTLPSNNSTSTTRKISNPFMNSSNKSYQRPVGVTRTTSKSFSTTSSTKSNPFRRK